MFYNFRRTMAVCVMALILLCGCAGRGQTGRTIRPVDEKDPSQSDLVKAGADDSSEGSPGRILTGDRSGTGNDSDRTDDSEEGSGPPPGHEAEREDGSGYPPGHEADKGDGSGPPPGQEADRDNGDGTEVRQNVPVIYVDVCGAVNTPGVVSLTEGSRVFQAIGKAGGLASDADGRYINQARVLMDGEQIYVPTRQETEEQSERFQNGAAGNPGFADAESADAGGSAAGGQAGRTSNGSSSAEGTADGGPDAKGKVNINTADSGTLQSLNGIGESRAEAIILYRENNGAFETIEDIMRVSGIKNAVFDKIKDDITVG